jgi:NAD(P)-dependent dehydrogenase (short-subunit alcohol dehydrogenase family)
MQILIAGANQGLGLCLAKKFAEDGHTVFAGYRSKMSAGLLELAGEHVNFTPVLCDVTDKTQVADAAKTIPHTLDAIIVTAGVLCDSDRNLDITKSDMADFRSALEVNVIGTELLIQALCKHVVPGGLFIIVTSEGGSMTNIGTRYPVYSVTKAAQNKLTATFAKTAAEEGFGYKVYAMHPGRMNTVMGRNDAQIEPEVSAQSIFEIVTGGKKISPKADWFIDYRGEPMVI